MLGKSNKPLVIVDADAIIALSNKEDANHQKAKQILEKLTTVHAQALFPTTAICESVTVLRGRLNKPDEAGSIIERLHHGDFPMQAVDPQAIFDAAAIYNPLASKKNTLFDAIVAALAKRLNADVIFSFDEWYRKIGMPLTDNLIAQSKAA
jgi:predicted nucleic acid-binding protein